MLRQIPHQEYLAADGISKSGLDQIAKSPAHYQAWLKEKPEPTKAMQFGSALHCALLEPEVFKATYTVAPEVDKRTTRGKAEFAEWEQANQGRIALTSAEFQRLTAMQDAFRSHSLVSGILSDALIERAAFWTCPDTGVLCKAKPDVVTSGLILDLKTTEDGRKRAFESSVANFRYHVQAAHYLRGVSTCTGSPHTEFLFVAIEKTAPFAISVYRADPTMVGQGEEILRANLRTYAECVASGQWPSYPDRVQNISLPAWA
jgi:hypothetical protein